MTMFGISSSKLRFEEAHSAYAEMAKENANKAGMLSTLLPRVRSVEEARLLVARAANNDKMEVLSLKKKLGCALRSTLGNLNSYYVLDCKLNIAR